MKDEPDRCRLLAFHCPSSSLSPAPLPNFHLLSRRVGREWEAKPESFQKSRELQRTEAKSLRHGMLAHPNLEFGQVGQQNLKVFRKRARDHDLVPKSNDVNQFRRFATIPKCKHRRNRRQGREEFYEEAMKAGNQAGNQAGNGALRAR